MEVVGLEREKRIVDLSVCRNYPVLFIGETGVGKTHLVRAIADERKKSLIRISLNGEVGVNELLGKWLVKDGSTYWQDGVLVSAMRRGDWLLMDEINAALPEVLFCLNSLLDDTQALVLAEKDGERIVPHSEFRLFATMNPTSEYAGTKEMNRALLSRFIVTVWMSGYSPTLELEIVRMHTKVDDLSGRIMVDVANKIRALRKDKQIFYYCSVRDVISWGKLFASKQVSLGESFFFSILSKAEEEERDGIITCAKRVIAGLNVDLGVNISDLKMRLTDDVKDAIKKLEIKKVALQKAVSELESKVSAIKVEVDK